MKIRSFKPRPKLADLRGALVALVFALAVIAMSFIPNVRTAFAQAFTLPPQTQFLGLFGTNGKPPVGTGCTIAAGSTDMAGSCTATASSGSIVFAKTNLVNAPFCLLQDTTGTPVNVYTTTALQITLTTITSTHVLRWFCVEQAGETG